MDKFNPRHFAFLILATAIVSLKTYPTIYIKDGGRDSWIAMIIASIIALAFFVYIIGICKKNNCYSLLEIYHKALGKTLGNVFMGLFIITLLITLVESSSAEASSMHTNMLLETPNWYLILFFVIPIIYTIRKEIVAIMTVTMIGIVLIMIAGINLSILTAKYKKIEYLLPIFENGIHLGFFISIIKILGLYGCGYICFPYLTKITNNKKIVKYVIIALLIIVQMQIISVSGLIMTFGPYRVNDILYPKLIQTQEVSYLRFMEFGELYVMLQVLGGWLLKYLITFYGMLMIFKEFKLKRKHLIYLTYIISAFICFLSYFVSKNIFILFKFFNYYSYICLVNFIIIPIIIFTIFSLKSKKGKYT